jgi:GNAT superfamily N-acetyltransferase
MSDQRYEIVPIAPTYDRADFDCGEPSLNDFLKRYARQNDDKDLGRTFIAVLPDDSHIYGYYTLSSSSVSSQHFPEKLPRYPTPVALLGRLAVDERTKGQGLGKILLLDALRRVLLLTDQLGIYAVEVHAINPEAKAFYLKYGFTSLLDDEQHLYLTLKDIRKIGLVL